MGPKDFLDPNRIAAAMSTSFLEIIPGFFHVTPISRIRNIIKQGLLPGTVMQHRSYPTSHYGFLTCRCSMCRRLHRRCKRRQRRSRQSWRRCVLVVTVHFCQTHPQHRCSIVRMWGSIQERFRQPQIRSAFRQSVRHHRRTANSEIITIHQRAGLPTIGDYKGKTA